MRVLDWFGLIVGGPMIFWVVWGAIRDARKIKTGYALTYSEHEARCLARIGQPIKLDTYERIERGLHL